MMAAAEGHGVLSKATVALLRMPRLAYGGM
jgi:hypothetical protein